jgi:Peptidase C13 family
MHRYLSTAFLVLLIGLLACSSAKAQPRAPQSDFADWAAVVIAGDWRGHDGGETNAFDNTRADVSDALVKAGFSPANVLQYSLRPPRPGDGPGMVVTPHDVVMNFDALGKKATAGCLFYISSHGGPEGAVFGPTAMLDPRTLKVILDGVCGERPTVVVVSACFSGVFVPVIAAPNRMIMTAAREDRSSFGCSDKDRYPYFDACILESWPTSPDFLVLSKKTKTCVTRRETEQHAEPPSEPQTYIGGQAKELLPFMRFVNRATGP